MQELSSFMLRLSIYGSGGILIIVLVFILIKIFILIKTDWVEVLDKEIEGGERFAKKFILPQERKHRKLYKIIKLLIIAAIILFWLVIIMQVIKIFTPDKSFPRRITASNQKIAEALDGERVRDRILIRQGLIYYFQNQHAYPMTLDELVPSFLSAIPVDPLTYDIYDYAPVDNRSDYKLCINFEANSECVTSQTAPFM